MQVRGKTLRCFSVILAFSKSLHETCRLLRALHTFFFLQAVYLGLTLCAQKQYVNLHRIHSGVAPTPPVASTENLPAGRT